MTDPQLFRGTGVAVITPYLDNAVDYDSLTKIVENLLAGGVDYIVALGTTGEAVVLSDKECKSVLNHIIKVVDKRCPIVAGMFGSNNTAALCQR